MSLIEHFMVQFLFIWNQETSKMQILFIKEVLDQIDINLNFGRRYFRPLQFSMKRNIIAILYFLYSFVNFVPFFLWAPYSPKNHNIALVMF